MSVQPCMGSLGGMVSSWRPGGAMGMGQRGGFRWRRSGRPWGSLCSSCEGRGGGCSTKRLFPCVGTKRLRVFSRAV